MKSLSDEVAFRKLHSRLELLGRKLNNFIKALERNHSSNFTINDPTVAYLNKYSNIQDPESNI